MSSDELLVVALLFLVTFFTFAILKVRSRLPKHKRQQEEKRRAKHAHRPRSREEYWQSLGVTMASGDGSAVSAVRSPAAAQGPAAAGGTPPIQKAKEPENELANLAPPQRGVSGGEISEYEARAEKAHGEKHYVEAYFWTLKAQYAGALSMKRSLMRYRAEWIYHGKPDEKDNVREDFTAWSGSFARAAMRIECGIHPHKSIARIKELAAAGHKESRQYLHRHPKDAGKTGKTRHGHHAHHGHSFVCGKFVQGKGSCAIISVKGE